MKTNKRLLKLDHCFVQVSHGGVVSFAEEHKQIKWIKSY